MRKLNIFLMAFLLTVVFASSGQCAAGAGYAPVDKARDAVLGYFLPVSGKIEDVREGTVKVRLEGESRELNNVRLTVFREGKPFYHPVTNENMGSTEYFAGRIEIRGKGPDKDLYTAVVTSGKVETGDRVRVPLSRIKLVFFQERKADWMISELFYNSLKESGRFEILEAYTPSYEPEELSRLARKLDAEAVLLFSTPLRGDKNIMNVKLFWSEDTAMFAEIEETLSADIADMSVQGDEFLSIGLIEREPWERFAVGTGMMMAMGDINNSGKMVFVVSDGNIIRIYSKRKDMREEWSIEGSPSERHLNIDVLDMNNNGFAEIFVTSIVNEKEIISYVLEYHPSGKFNKIRDNIPYFMRVSGNKLLMQKHGYNKPFNGPVYEGTLKDGDYQPGKPLALPEGLNIYGFIHIDWQESGKTHLLALDDKGFLDLYDSDNNHLWKSRDTYGKPVIAGKIITQLSYDPSEEWFVRDRLTAVKTDRGQEVFLVKRIPELELIPGFGYKEAEVYSLWWNGEEMDHRLVLKDLPGSVRDYRIAGNSLFILARTGIVDKAQDLTSGNFSAGSEIYHYNIKEQ